MAKETPKAPDPFDPDTMMKAHKALRLCTAQALALRGGVSYYFGLSNQTVPELSDQQCRDLALAHPYTLSAVMEVFQRRDINGRI
jgi:hypothetical protein